jgi:P27 family predicted phage terminase small subunit
MGKRGPLPAADQNVVSIRTKRPPLIAPPFVVAEPAPPSWLKQEAKAEWRRVVPELLRLKLLAQLDRAVLASYCQAWAFAQQARVRLEREGLTGMRDGQPTKHPCWQEWREATALTVTLGKQLGLTPDARLRAAKPEAPDDDADDLD